MFKLGRDTGSLVNYVQGNSKSLTPEIGMGATILGWSDRHAATIVSVDKYRGRVRVGVQGDNATRTDKNGMSECQEYSFTANPDAAVQYFTENKNGAFIQMSRDWDGKLHAKQEGTRLAIGYRDEYYDFSF